VTITRELQSEFKKLSAKFKTVSVTHVKDLEHELIAWQTKGLIKRKFYEQNYGSFLFYPPDRLRNARSIIIIAIPQKIRLVKFVHQGTQYQTVYPPTYHYSQIRFRCNDIISSVLGKKGYSVDRAILPMKLLAIRSGLGKYGKNNLCYVEGMGSFTRLEAFYTDYEFPTDDWCEKQLLDSCKTCNLCKNACLIHAIPDKRILIHADHCLTYLNENKGDFPAWVPKQSHNALVGCMQCQNVCPQNKKYLTPDQHLIEFTDEEISTILRKTPRKDIPQALATKLLDLDLDEYYPLLERNLSALMQIRRSRSTS